jgi:alkylglycerol monooxygenase
MALAGVPPLVFATVALIDLLYQYWVHTQQIGRLGWFDRWFCSPSNHRVHHAVNDRYLDKELRRHPDRLGPPVRQLRSKKTMPSPCVYGTRAPLRSFNPLWANLQVYRDLALDSWHARRWADKLAVWFKPPGWRPADVAARWPKPAFDAGNSSSALRPTAGARNALRAWLRWPVCGLVLCRTGQLLWHAHQLDRWPTRPWARLAMVAVCSG